MKSNIGLGVGAAVFIGASAHAQSPVMTCDDAGIGTVQLQADGPQVSILSVSSAVAGSGANAVPYCLVKVHVPTAINIWVGLPTDGKWNGRWQSVGGGGYGGVAHCAGGTGPQPQGLFQAVVDWVEQDKAPETILASKPVEGGMQSRPLCPYPSVARWKGSGSTDDAVNFVCTRDGPRHEHRPVYSQDDAN
jgi:hypothetical protein